MFRSAARSSPVASVRVKLVCIKSYANDKKKTQNAMYKTACVISDSCFTTRTSHTLDEDVGSLGIFSTSFIFNPPENETGNRIYLMRERSPSLMHRKGWKKR